MTPGLVYLPLVYEQLYKELLMHTFDTHLRVCEENARKTYRQEHKNNAVYTEDLPQTFEYLVVKINIICYKRIKFNTGDTFSYNCTSGIKEHSFK